MADIEEDDIENYGTPIDLKSEVVIGMKYIIEIDRMKTGFFKNKNYSKRFYVKPKYLHDNGDANPPTGISFYKVKDSGYSCYSCYINDFRLDRWTPWEDDPNNKGWKGRSRLMLSEEYEKYK